MTRERSTPTQGRCNCASLRSHDTFRQRLAEIEASLAGGGPDAAVRGVESLASLFAAHKVAEEQMLHDIGRAIRAESGAR